MIINHNIAAINAFNKLNNNTKHLGASMEKLSSGLRISSASDDAADLAISEKMRGQIRGLQVAERNIQDGVSLVQTAEAGLATIQDPPLQRLRELAVKASNDTMTDTDRREIQKEVEQIIEGIDEIANNTTFNGIPLLNITDATSSSSNNSGGDSTIGNPGESGTATPGSDGSYLNFPGNILETHEMTYNGFFRFYTKNGFPETHDDNLQYLADFIRGEVDVDGRKIDYDFDSVPEIRVNGENISFRISVPVSSKVEDNLDQYTWAVREMEITQTVRVVGDKYEIKYKIKNTSDEAVETGFKFNLDLVAGGNQSQVGTDYKDGHLEYGEILEDDIPDSIYVLGFTAAANPISGEAIIRSRDGFHVMEPPDKMIVADQLFLSHGTAYDGSDAVGQVTFGELGMSLWWDDRTLQPGESFEVNTFYGLKTPTTYLGDGQPSNGAGDSGGTGQNGDENSGNNKSSDGLILQVGPNAGNQFLVQRSDVTTEELGIEDISLLTNEASQNSLKKIDQALKTISSERSKYGAYHNALEHIHSNVANYEQNLVTSESRIRDLDMAKEIMNQTTKSILAQTAQAMLAQSNQMPEGVLQLLRGV